MAITPPDTAPKYPPAVPLDIRLPKPLHDVLQDFCERTCRQPQEVVRLYLDSLLADGTEYAESRFRLLQQGCEILPRHRDE